MFALCSSILLANTAVPVPLHLRNGSNQYEGRVEVYYRGQWGTICDNNWDIEDAKCVTIALMCVTFALM